MLQETNSPEIDSALQRGRRGTTREGLTWLQLGLPHLKPQMFLSGALVCLRYLKKNIKTVHHWRWQQGHSRPPSHLDDAGSIFEVCEGPHDIPTHRLHWLFPRSRKASNQLSDTSCSGGRKWQEAWLLCSFDDIIGHIIEKVGVQRQYVNQTLLTFLALQAVQVAFLHQSLGLLHKCNHPSKRRGQNLFDELLDRKMED